MAYLVLWSRLDQGDASEMRFVSDQMEHRIPHVKVHMYVAAFTLRNTFILKPILPGRCILLSILNKILNSFGLTIDLKQTAYYCSIKSKFKT